MSTVLHLPGLLMRPWTQEDADALLSAFSDLSIRHYATTVVDSAAAADRFIGSRTAGWTERTGMSWAITDAAARSVLGHVGIHVVEQWLGYATIGYWLLPRARGRGVATQAVRAATTAAFAHLDLHRIELAHAIENYASCAVAERCGYPYEGTLRDAMRYAGDRWSTEHLHARLVTDES